MRALLDGNWREGPLDYFRAPHDYRLRPLLWRNVVAVEDIYFVRPRSWRLVFNYLREIGPREVARKVRSRTQERHRNEKWLSCGLGLVLEGPAAGRFPSGQLLSFVAPNHPACVERIVLPDALLAPGDDVWQDELDEGEILYEPLSEEREDPQELAELAGWSPHAGTPVDERAVADALRRWLPASPDDIDWQRARRLPARGVASPSERRSPTTADRGEDAPRKVSATLFGYGNYAKTALLPNVSSVLAVETVHELDPLQIPLGDRGSVTWDTSPLMRDDESCEVVLIAGYHATHASLATEALQRGASAVVEKPIATTSDQLDRLLAALTASPGRLFSCYQRRYSPLTALARRDLGLSRGEPVSYHCIVYEVPLPSRHWYRWPSSGSRLLSNGCHWIDHFLFLNDFADARRYQVFLGANDSINCSMELSNGASFTMVLTEAGSARLGVRDHVELRREDKTVTIVDNSQYKAESTEKVLRKARVNKAESYRTMYSRIANGIRAGDPGDSAASVLVSAGAVLKLEEELSRAHNAALPLIS